MYVYQLYSNFRAICSQLGSSKAGECSVQAVLSVGWTRHQPTEGDSGHLWSLRSPVLHYTWSHKSR